MVLNLRARTAVLAAALLAGCGVAGGCVGIGDFLDPGFLQSLGLRESVALLPGEAPAIVMEVENRTSRVAEFRVTWRDADGQIQERTYTLGVGGKYAEMIICPVEEITLGDVSNLDATGAIVRLGQGTSSAEYIEIEPFGVLLQNGINYDCGDNITFAIQKSSATLSGYRIFAYIRRSGVENQIEMQSP